MQNQTLSDVTLDEVGIDFDRLFGILQRFWERGEFGVRCRTIIIASRVAGITLDGFCIEGHRIRKLTSLSK
jgi:hypothetical protein